MLQLTGTPRRLVVVLLALGLTGGLLVAGSAPASATAVAAISLTGPGSAPFGTITVTNPSYTKTVDAAIVARGWCYA